MAKSNDNLALVLVLGITGFVAYRALKGSPAIASAITTLPNLVPSGGGGATTAPAGAPRGIRNNNPGNILATSDNWKGEVGSDGAYTRFDNAQHGYRAMFIILKKYIRNYGLNTIAKIATRWAPAPQNIPANWASNVAKLGGLSQTVTINPADTNQMIALARGITGAENGASWVNYYSTGTIAAALAES